MPTKPSVCRYWWPSVNSVWVGVRIRVRVGVSVRVEVMVGALIKCAFARCVAVKCED